MFVFWFLLLKKVWNDIQFNTTVDENDLMIELTGLKALKTFVFNMLFCFHMLFFV